MKILRLPRRLIPRASNVGNRRTSASIARRRKAGPCPKSDRRRGGRREEPFPHPAFVDVTITARSTCCNGGRRTELNGAYRTFHVDTIGPRVEHARIGGRGCPR